jgi:hypothetical protein|tara:strand:+ start:2210 stop:2404 length:195 start_codon:yes stop_codon:yes gene_type:complete
MRLLIFCLVLTACASSPVEKEWNDKYDPASWRRQFEECRDLLYTAYPEEVQRDQWSECMDRDYE